MTGRDHQPFRDLGQCGSLFVLTFGLGGKPDVEIIPEVEKMIMTGALPQHAARKEYPRRFVDENVEAETADRVVAQRAADPVKSAPVVGEVVRGVVIAEILQPLGNGLGVLAEIAGERPGGIGKTKASAGINHVDRSLGGCIGMPVYSVGIKKALAPSLPERLEGSGWDGCVQG